MMRKRFLLGLIIGAVSILFLVIGIYMIENMRADIAIYCLYLFLFLLGCSTYLIRSDRIQELQEEDYILTSIIVIIFVIITILLAILDFPGKDDFTIREWFGAALLWFVVIMYSIPLFRKFLRIKKTNN